MQATTPVSPPLNGGDGVSAARARRRATGRLSPVTAPVESIGDARATRVATPLSQLPKLVCPIRAHAPEGSKYRSQVSAMSSWPMPGFVQSHTPWRKIMFKRTSSAGVKVTV